MAKRCGRGLLYYLKFYKPIDMHAAKGIRVVLPAYNEAEVIADVIKGIRAQGIEAIVVINDGSRDDTVSVAERNGATVVSHMINRGAGAACQTAIQLAREQGWPGLIFMDADGQHFPEDIPHLLKKMSEGECDLLIGSRFLQKGNTIPPTRVVFNGIANLLTNLFCKHRYSDTQSGFRMLNQKAIEQISLQIDGFGFCSEMIQVAEQQNLRIQEVPIRVRYSTYSIRKGQDFQIGINTAINFIWNTIFK